eukprot:359833-Chlamydomonas_euryale.AAC.10
MLLCRALLGACVVGQISRTPSPRVWPVQMKRSQVEGPNHTGLVDNVRTSAGTFLRRHQTKVITAIEERMSLWTQLPISHQEDIQVLRYGPTNKYGEHMDGLGRVLSVLIYLVRE